MTRYVIIGAGATGASLAAQFHLHGQPYLLVARGRQAEVLRRSGLVYQRPDRRDTLRLAVTTSDAETELRRDDVLIFTPKAQDLDAALGDWAWRPVSEGGVASQLPAVTLQNGLESERWALRRFPRVLGASLNQAALFIEPGHVSVRSAPTPGVFMLGAFPGGPSALAETVAEDLRRSGYAVQTTEDIGRWKAAKLLFNVKNAVDVFGGSPETTARLRDALVSEAREVLTAAAIDFAGPEERTVDDSGFIVRKAPDEPPGMSTWQSFARGDARGQEADYLNGEIALIARLHGLEAPLNAAVQEALAVSFRAGEPPGTRDVESILRSVAA
ncbi:ketopantoate reductase family protein [Leucobacter celer]|uniref:ketopantoate reductase family protein n=1 Tax=Leucobacter celer TaxID=668625 RepID=UPI0006A7723A|nr:2-dehydropantoate 2-reductase N-terminal domain-containing protein [Leucobacter celer]